MAEGRTVGRARKDSMLLRTVGQRIRQKRERKGWTVKELARRAEFPHSKISKIENGQQSPSLSDIEDLAKAFDLPFMTLMQELDPTHPSLSHAQLYRESQKLPEPIADAFLQIMRAVNSPFDSRNKQGNHHAAQ